MPKDCEKEEEEVEAKATPTHLNRRAVDKQTIKATLNVFIFILFNYAILSNYGVREGS